MKTILSTNELVLELTLIQNGKYTVLLIGVNPTQETTLISAQVSSKNDLTNLLITLSTENLTRERLLENFKALVVDIQIADDLYVTRKGDVIDDYQWRKFLQSIKDMDLWDLIRETGFHELLPEK